MPSPSDHETVDQELDRDLDHDLDQDFDSWVRPHLMAMHRLAAVSAGGADPEDVVQEALARAWTKRRMFDPARGDARSWLLAITFDQSRRARRGRHRPWRTTSVDIDHTYEPVSNIDLSQAINALSRRQAQVVLLYYYVDLPVAQVAAVLGCSAGTVKSTLSDARRALAISLKESSK